MVGISFACNSRTMSSEYSLTNPENSNKDLPTRFKQSFRNFFRFESNREFIKEAFDCQKLSLDLVTYLPEVLCSLTVSELYLRKFLPAERV